VKTLSTILAFTILATALPCFGASTIEAESFLKKSIGEVVGIAKNSPNSAALAESIRPVLLKTISFDAMTRRAVGPGWRQFTPEQQKEATRLFATLVIRTYSAKFTPGELPEISYKSPTSPTPERVEIPTTTLYKGSKYNVTYRVENIESWRITDVVIEGVSMVANYRTQFDAEFKQGGAEAAAWRFEKIRLCALETQ
jgi:phospholipid transport system substrate-binding protein